MCSYFILALFSQLRGNNVLLSLFPSVQAAALVSVKGVTEVSRAGGLRLLCCTFTTQVPDCLQDTVVSHSCSLRSDSRRPKALYTTSNLPRLHLKDPEQVQSQYTELSKEVMSQASSFLLWSEHWKEFFHSFILFYSSPSSKPKVIYRVAVAGQQGKTEKSKAGPVGGKMSP